MVSGFDFGVYVSDISKYFSKKHRVRATENPDTKTKVSGDLLGNLSSTIQDLENHVLLNPLYNVCYLPLTVFIEKTNVNN